MHERWFQLGAAVGLVSLCCLGSQTKFVPASEPWGATCLIASKA